ncbi:DoxX family protein [Arenimonas aestuarii]
MKTRALCYLLALVFVLSGAAKLLSLPFETDAFARWGYPLVFMYVIGALELAGAVGLLLPRLSALAGFCLSALMLGAVATHLRHGEWVMVGVALGILLAAFWCGWRQRSDLRRLFGGRASAG